MIAEDPACLSSELKLEQVVSVVAAAAAVDDRENLTVSECARGRERERERLGGHLLEILISDFENPTTTTTTTLFNIFGAVK